MAPRNPLDLTQKELSQLSAALAKAPKARHIGLLQLALNAPRPQDGSLTVREQNEAEAHRQVQVQKEKEADALIKLARGSTKEQANAKAVDETRANAKTKVMTVRGKVSHIVDASCGERRLRIK